jgi:hypothetical protein
MLKTKSLSMLLCLLLAGFMAFTACDEDGGMEPVDDDTYTQVDRMGIPALNTVFNHPLAFSKVDYNTSGPATDVANYSAQFVTVLGAVANANPAGTAAALLPDELPVNLASATSNFALLDGRKPSDDATDVALTVVVGVAALQSDNVDANDVAFLNSFPYLAPPN